MFYLYHCTHFILYIDVYLMLKYPFSPQRTRNKKYTLIFVIVLALASLVTHTAADHAEVYLMISLALDLMFILIIAVLVCLILYYMH